MKKEIAVILSGVAKGSVYDGYSGRGMYGKTTTGFVAASLESVLADVLRAVANGELTMDDFQDMAMDYFTTDSMGKNVIIY